MDALPVRGPLGMASLRGQSPEGRSGQLVKGDCSTNDEDDPLGTTWCCCECVSVLVTVVVVSMTAISVGLHALGLERSYVHV